MAAIMVLLSRKEIDNVVNILTARNFSQFSFKSHSALKLAYIFVILKIRALDLGTIILVSLWIDLIALEKVLGFFLKSVLSEFRNVLSTLIKLAKSDEFFLPTNFLTDKVIFSYR